MGKIIFEACVESIDSAIAAEIAGADRIELCSDLEIGGITPSYGLIKSATEKLTLPVNVLIRPRGGDFVYSEQEFEVMKQDILLCRDNGVNGIVIGILHSNNTVDKERTLELIDIAQPMSITFHRAFDETVSPIEALETLINLKVDRLLTSGQTTDAYSGKDTIKKLVDYAKDRIIIMPGGGVNESNIAEIIKYTGIKEIHGSARTKNQNGLGNSFSKKKLTSMLKAIKN